MASCQLLREYKLVVIGSGGVGKSALTIQFMHNRFVEDYDPTIEDLYRKECFIDGVETLVDVLDTAGQEEFSAMREHYMLDGEGFLLVYSITERDSFKMIESYHQQILRVKDTQAVPIILVGNKSDLECERRVDMVEGQDIAEKLGCRFVETSAKVGSNVTETFIDLVCEIRDRNREMLEMRRILRPITPDSAIQLPGAGCWNKGCNVS
ncbi:ras family-domain-containing protein [Russula emetica]|nr:ras family-domain-containing protein [Russula emetica]